MLKGEKLIDYLYHRITLAELVDWAESAMMEADFEEKDFEIVRNRQSRWTGRCQGLWHDLGRLRRFSFTVGLPHQHKSFGNPGRGLARILHSHSPACL